jgi:hypothetical protein
MNLSQAYLYGALVVVMEAIWTMPWNGSVVWMVSLSARLVQPDAAINATYHGN